MNFLSLHSFWVNPMASKVFGLATSEQALYRLLRLFSIVGVRPLRWARAGAPFTVVASVISLAAFFQKNAAPYRSKMCALSSSNSLRFTSRPQAKPVRAPFFPTTRWQGVKINSGLSWFAIPTARAALGRPTNPAISP